MQNRAQTVRDRVIGYRANPDLPREQAAARISAYVYGNILIFATLVPFTADDVEHGHAIYPVLGVAVSTYLAHVFADLIGESVRHERPLTRPDVLHELRDAVPILTSAGVPVLLLLLGRLGVLAPTGALIAAEAFLFVRMAIFGLLLDRLHATERASFRTVFVGVAVAVVAAAISLVKVLLAH